MLPYHLQTLGTATLVGPDGDVVRLRTRKHFALLIYLAVEPPRPIRRDRLAHLLWGAAAMLAAARGIGGRDYWNRFRREMMELPQGVTRIFRCLGITEPPPSESTKRR